MTNEFQNLAAVRQRQVKTMCPWCGSVSPPASTHLNLDIAEFVYCSPSKAAADRNPLMCVECHGVGGVEDFQVE